MRLFRNVAGEKLQQCELVVAARLMPLQGVARDWTCQIARSSFRTQRCIYFSSANQDTAQNNLSVPVPYCQQYTLAKTVVMVTCGHSNMPPFLSWPTAIPTISLPISDGNFRSTLGVHKYFVQMCSTKKQPFQYYLSVIYLINCKFWLWWYCVLWRAGRALI